MHLEKLANITSVGHLTDEKNVMSMRDAANRMAKQGEQGNQIDLTPMLDVVFIMLIFFIVTSSFIKEPGVELFKPQASTTEACPNGTILIAVDESGKLHYNKDEISLDKVAFELAKAKEEAPLANVVVQVSLESPAWVAEDLVDKIRPILTAPPCVSTDEEA